MGLFYSVLAENIFYVIWVLVLVVLIGVHNGSLRTSNSISRNILRVMSLFILSSLFVIFVNYPGMLTKASLLPQTPMDRAIQNGEINAEMFRKGILQAQLDHSNELLASNPKDIKALNTRATLKIQLDDIDGAIKDFDKVIKLDSKNIKAYNNRGITKARLKDNKGAIKDFDKVISLEPDNIRAYNNRAVAKLALADKKGALKDFEKTRELMSKMPEEKEGRHDKMSEKEGKHGQHSHKKESLKKLDEIISGLKKELASADKK